MKPAESTILKQLRKTTLAYLSNADFAQVEKAVEKQGISGLTGVALKLVTAAVQKHGSHNQSSHGGKGGGAGGGGGGSGGTGDSGSKKGLKRGDTLDNMKNAEGVKVKISGGSALSGKKATVTQSAPSGKFHGVKTSDGKEGYIHGSDLTVISTGG